jgi:Tfp pilus assembly protein PilF
MRIFACGRLTHYPRRSWERLLARAGGAVSRRLQDADLVVVGGGAAAWPTEKFKAAIANADRRGVPVIGERAMLRRIGVLAPLPEEARPYLLADLGKRAGLSIATLRLLALFDVIEGEDERYGFRAMKAAKAAAVLLEKVGLADLVAACHSVRSAFNVAEPLSELQLTADHGRIVLSAGGRIADLDGQLRLELQVAHPSIDALLAGADEARADGRDDLAEGYLRQALAVSPRDADVLFELGSLLCEQEKFPEGLAVLHKAANCQPGFADAWYNIGHALERQDRPREARDAYLRAAEADPRYADPLFNLGMLSLEDGDFPAAIDRFESYLKLDRTSGWADKARKAIALARLSIVQAAAAG